MACRCQQFGKSGVPWPSGKCMVCGEPVDVQGAITGSPEGANRLTPDERYVRDAMFHHLVDYLRASIEQAQYTPTELREAVILAATHHEMFSTRRIMADRR